MRTILLHNRDPPPPSKKKKERSRILNSVPYGHELIRSNFHSDWLIRNPTDMTCVTEKRGNFRARFEIDRPTGKINRNKKSVPL